MKSRTVSFYIDLDALPPLMAAIEDIVIPRYEAIPQFLGLTLIKHDVLDRAEVIVTLSGTTTSTNRRVKPSASSTRSMS
jgi:hypothetical protein